MTRLVLLTHASTGPEALLYALIARHDLIQTSFFTGPGKWIPTKKRRQAKELRDKLTRRTRQLMADSYPGNIGYSIERQETRDYVGDIAYWRYLLRVKYPLGVNLFGNE